MKLLVCLLCLLPVLACAQELPDTKNREVVFLSVNVVPMNEEKVLPNQVVVVRDGKITAIGPNARYGRNALVINARGKYLMPGLAEMHAHVPPIDDIEPMKEVLLLFAARGVTTIRGMLGHPRHLELRSKVQRGELLGPRFITSGPSFSGQSVKTEAAAADMVRQQKTAGYDFLKLHPGLTRQTFAAMASTAREVNIPFAGHVSFDVGVWRAIEAGYATIDHLDGFVESLVPGIENTTEQQNGLFGMFLADRADTTRIPRLMTALREKNVWVVPTQALAERWFAPDSDPDALAREPEMIYMQPGTVAGWVNTKKNLLRNPQYNADALHRFIALRRKLIYECNRAGVGLLLGSDAPQVFDVPGFSVHHELRYLVASGLSPYEALRTGTANVGRFLNIPGLGTVTTGAPSDLVLLSGNPLTDINATTRIEGVMLGARWLPADWIASTLKKLEKR